MALRIAIMQPYFLPYAGYFRLFTSTDLFVIYDCVQFARRGWVHRNRLPDHSGNLQWLTLPLEKAPQSVRIRDLRFAPDAAQRFAASLRRFPVAASRKRPLLQPLWSELMNFDRTPLDYLEATLQEACRLLDLPHRLMRSSALKLPDDLRGEDRILAIVKSMGAEGYVNAPGGRYLYDHRRFSQAGVQLRFLGDYDGSYDSILSRLANEDSRDIAADIRRQSVFAA